MRVVLIGPASRRHRIRAELPEGIAVVAEVATLSEARAFGDGADAYLLTAGTLAEDDRLIEPLTPREIQVLALVADGLSNKTIAGSLGVSDETIKFHLGSIFGKLGASNRTDAVRRALRLQLIQL